MAPRPKSPGLTSATTKTSPMMAIPSRIFRRICRGQPQPSARLHLQAQSELPLYPAPEDAMLAPDDPPPRDEAPHSGNGSTEWSSGNGHSRRNGYEAGEDYTGRSKVIAEHIYRAIDGSNYMLVQRKINPRKFSTATWENGRWAWHKPEQPILYRLPELLAAPPDTVVYVCEGEKDADNLAKLELVATTAPYGAPDPKYRTAKWRPEYAEAFRGKQLVYALGGQ